MLRYSGRSMVTGSLLLIVAGCGKAPNKGKYDAPPLLGGQAESGPALRSIPSAKDRETEIQQLQADLRRLEGKLAKVTPATVHVQGEVSLPTSMLGSEILWGSDLQFAQQRDPSTSKLTANKVTVLGHKIAKFIRVNNRVILQSDDSSEAESDALQGLTLIEFSIVSESAGQLNLLPLKFGTQSAAWLGISAQNFQPFFGSCFIKNKYSVD